MGNKPFYLLNPISEYVNGYGEHYDERNVLLYWRWWIEIKKVGKYEDGGDFQSVG